MSETQTKTLAEMTAEVVANNTRLGWYENCATFPEAMALLHSEVSEALEAWREHGLRDATAIPTRLSEEWDGECPNKPEGVGSEFADIFIRLLDDAWLFGQVDLEAAATKTVGRYVLLETFPANMCKLHVLISRTAEAGMFDMSVLAAYFGEILVFLGQLCVEYEIDLQPEYERKMAFNRTREYRHGGKRL